MRLVFSAGEASGDAYGATILQAIRSVASPFTDFLGIGSRRLESAGCKLLADSSKWGAIGIIESLMVAPKVYRDSRALVRELKQGAPGVFVPIDFGFLNIKLARLAKSRGWKVLYFAPPSSWRRDKQGQDLPDVTDAIVTQFSWSQEILSQMGASAFWFGHPLNELIARSAVQVRGNSIAVLPGSRVHEIVHNLPPIAQASCNWNSPVEFAVSANLDPQVIQHLWKKHGGNDNALFTQNDTYGVLKRSRAAVICSGTATLEAALCDCPCVVMYRGSKLVEIEFKIRKPNFQFISLPNILLEMSVLPELIQHDANDQTLNKYLLPLLEESEQRKAQVSAFEELKAQLGSENCFAQTTELLIQMAQVQSVHN